MKIINGMEEIRAAQTVKFPSGDEVRLAFPQYTKGYITAFYNHRINKWVYGYTEDRESAFEHFEETKLFCSMGMDNWMNFSEMYIYHSFKEFNPVWALMCMVVDD